MKRHIREFGLQDIDLIINYFLQADHTFLKMMGVEPNKFPKYDEWSQILLKNFNRPIEYKHFYYVIWEINNVPIGHSNINKIIYGTEAYMHLHIWESAYRQSGHGTFFIRESISCYFSKFNLRFLYCEPYELNPAPNKTLSKVGFDYIHTYETIPGWINFVQPVNRWMLSREKWLEQAKSGTHNTQEDSRKQTSC